METVIFLNPPELRPEVYKSAENKKCNFEEQAVHARNCFQELIEHNNLPLTFLVCNIESEDVIAEVIFANLILW